MISLSLVFICCTGFDMPNLISLFLFGLDTRFGQKINNGIRQIFMTVFIQFSGDLNKKHILLYKNIIDIFLDKISPMIYVGTL